MKKKRKLKILFLATLASGTVYYRFYNLFQQMQKKKMADVAFYPYFDPDKNEVYIWEKQLKTKAHLDKLWKLCSHADIIVSQKLHSDLGLAFFNMMAGELKKPVIMETDDDFTAVDNASPSYHAYNPGSNYEQICMDQLRSATVVVSSTDYLKEKFSVFNRNIEVIPNSIDFKLWDKIKNPKKKNKKIIIGWIGSCTHYKDLLMIKPAIIEILKKYKGKVEFYCVGYDPGIFDGIKGIKIINKWENILEYPKLFASFGFDIGLAPLKDSYFNRAKSNLRWLEYSALKIPTVASNVEPMKKIVGKVVDNDVDKWVSALSELIESKSKRIELGKKAYGVVKKNFNVEKTAQKYVNVLEDVVKKYKKGVLV